MRKINVWRKVFTEELFQQPKIEPASGKVDASVWRKGKSVGVINQFARGKRMRDYAEAIKSNILPAE